MAGQTLFFIVDEALDAQVTTDLKHLTLESRYDAELMVNVDEDYALSNVCSQYVREFLKITKPGLYEVDIAVFPLRNNPLVRAVKSANRAIRKAFQAERDEASVAEIL